MEIEEELKSNGIEVIEKLDDETIKSIAEFVASGICNTFPKLHFNYHDLFDEICNLPMFIANIPIGLAEASYFYKNSSIYFRDGMGLSDLKKFAIHEIIHHIQEIKDDDGTLLRLGLLELHKSKPYGVGLNEAAVQIISSYILSEPLESVKYYGIEFSTISPNYYPLICNLMSQICYLVGEDLLYDSTFYSNDNFKNRLISLTNKKTFDKIESNFDKLLAFEEQIAILNNNLTDKNCPSNKVKKYTKLIIKYKQKIKNTFLETQNYIFTSYFNNEFKKLNSEHDIEVFKNNLLIYKDLIGSCEDYFTFTNYHHNMIDKINTDYNLIITKSLIQHKPNKLLEFFKKFFKYDKNL